MRLWNSLREVAWLSVLAISAGIAGVILSVWLPALAVALGFLSVASAILSFRE